MRTVVLALATITLLLGSASGNAPRAYDECRHLPGAVAYDTGDPQWWPVCTQRANP